jgi:multiple sugar transport system ATP-binding protein
LAFPLRSPLRRTPDAEIRRRVQKAAEILRITHLLERKTAHLSGGEMQRVSLGRAIVREPRIFLMDEPLSNLDAKLRESLRVELKHIQKTQGSTTLFVTHDQVEALTMADRIAVLNKGRITQVGTPTDIYDQPATTFVAQLVGVPRINLLAARCDNGTLNIVDSPLEFARPGSCDMPATFQMGVRPEHLQPAPQGEFSGRLALIEPLGVESILHIKIGEPTLVCTVPGMTHHKLGDEVRFNIVRERLHYFREDGTRIPV